MSFSAVSFFMNNCIVIIPARKNSYFGSNSNISTEYGEAAMNKVFIFLFLIQLVSYSYIPAMERLFGFAERSMDDQQDDPELRELLEAYDRQQANSNFLPSFRRPPQAQAVAEIAETSKIRNFSYATPFLAVDMVEIVRTGSIVQVRSFIEEKLPSINYTDEMGRTLAHKAAFCCEDPEVVLLLLKMGIDLDIKDMYGKVAVDYAEEYQNATFSLGVMTFLIEKSSNAAQENDTNFVIALFCIALRIEADVLALECLKNIMDLDYKDAQGNTILHLLAGYKGKGAGALLKAFFRRDIILNVFSHNLDSKAPLDIAIKHDNKLFFKEYRKYLSDHVPKSAFPRTKKC